jgi:hypothetical protein
MGVPLSTTPLSLAKESTVLAEVMLIPDPTNDVPPPAASLPIMNLKLLTSRIDCAIASALARPGRVMTAAAATAAMTFNLNRVFMEISRRGWWTCPQA